MDVYLDEDRVLTGSARISRQERELASIELLKQDQQRKERQIASKRKAIQTQIAILQSEAEDEETELKFTIAQELLRQQSAEKNARAQVAIRGGVKLIPSKPTAFDLRLYVAGQTAKSMTALANLKQICETHLAGEYRIEVIDLLKTPQLAAGDQILAVPTLVRRLPEPIKKIIGDLSNEERVLVGLDVQPTMV